MKVEKRNRILLYKLGYLLERIIKVWRSGNLFFSRNLAKFLLSLFSFSGNKKPSRFYFILNFFGIWLFGEISQGKKKRIRKSDPFTQKP